MKYLTKIIPEREKRIRDLRSTDPEFAEICSDFKTLTNKMAKIEKCCADTENAAIAQRQSDIRASLAGLEYEIRTIFRKSNSDSH